MEVFRCVLILYLLIKSLHYYDLEVLMVNNTSSLKVFKCPSCGAPLDLKSDASTMKCPYCNGTVVVPDSLRESKPASLSDVTRLAKEGKLDEAAKIYSKITGLSHENAMFSVKSMAGIRDDDPVAKGSYPQQVSPSYQAPPTPQPVYQPKVRVGGGSCISTVIRLVVFISILGSAVPALLGALQFKLPFDLPFFSEGNSIIPVPFAKEVMSFRASSLKDPRAIGLDGNGNIRVFNYNSSDVQIFDPEGKEISVLAITESNGKELNNDSMGVRRDGTMYIPGFQSIMIFNEKGERRGEIVNKEDLFIIYSVTVGADDKVYALSNTGIVRLNEDGKVDLRISEQTIEEATGESIGVGAMGVDAQGNIYFSGDFVSDILKFSPTGEFIDRFAGDFDSVRQIAFDNSGRIYVVDFFDVKVYDASHNYIDKIDGAFWGVDFDSQNNMYGVTTQGDKVVKFEIRNPQE
jgi:LSD1 subclass zinc finger protein